MSVALIIGVTVVFLLVLLAILAYLLGVQLGGRQWKARVEELQAESLRATRVMHDLTRQAFVAMAEHAERRLNGE